jgi:hypothetical protein
MCNFLDVSIEGFVIDDPVRGQKMLPGSWWQCSFTSRYHGTVEAVAELRDFASVSVKVSWKCYEKKY